MTTSNFDTTGKNSPLLDALIEKRNALEDELITNPFYKQLCAVNYLLEREYLALREVGDSSYYPEEGFQDIILTNAEDYSNTFPESSSSKFIGNLICMHMQNWQEEEVAAIKQWFQSGLKDKEIAERLKRSEWGVMEKRLQLGLRHKRGRSKAQATDTARE